MFGYYALTSKQEMFGFHTTDLQARDSRESEKPTLDQVKGDAAGNCTADLQAGDNKEFSE